MAKKPDYYAVLGVKPTASAKEIKNAYRQLAKQLHPDLGGDAAKLAAVNEAADVLSDPERRAAYDRERGTGGAASSASGTKAGSAPRTEEKPPPKATVALCEYCNSVNRVKGDPRYYPASCGKCGKPLGTKPAEPESKGDPFADFAAAASQAPTQARCPHCQMRNRVTVGPGRPITCLGCGREFVPGTGDNVESLGKILGDLTQTLFGGGADTTVRGMKLAEDKLREMADEVRRRREDLEKRKGS